MRDSRPQIPNPRFQGIPKGENDKTSRGDDPCCFLFWCSLFPWNLGFGTWHFRVLALACVATLLSCCGAAGEDLLEAHLAQSRELAPFPAQKGSDEYLAKLKAEITAKEKEWTERLEGRSLGKKEDMLQGIPESARTQARELAADVAKLRASLQSGVSLDFLLALVSERSPEVRVASQNWRATLRRFDQAWYLEELLAQYRAFVRELDTKVGPQTHKEMPGKTFAFPSVLALKGQIVDVEAELAQLRYRQAQRKGMNAMARSYFEIAYATKAIANLRETRTLFSQMAQSAQAQLEAGRAMQADVLKAQSELAMLDNRVATLEREHASLVARANTILALPSDSPWGALAPVELVPSGKTPEQVILKARENCCDLLIALKDAELMHLMVRMAETEFLPRASVGYSQLAPSLGAEAGPTRSRMAAFPDKPEVTTEYAAFGVNAAYLDELRVRAKQADEMKEAAGADAEREAVMALYEVDAMRWDFKTNSERVVPLARQAFDAAKVRYSNGDTPFIELLDAGRTYLQSTLAKEEARRGYSKALINLEDMQGRAAGRLLPKTDKKPEPQINADERR